MISPFGGERRTQAPSTPTEPTWEELLKITPEKQPVDPPEVVEFSPTPIEAPIGLHVSNKNVVAVQELSNGLAETEARIAKEEATKAARAAFLAKQAADLAAFQREQLTKVMAQDAARVKAIRDGLDVTGIEEGVQRLKKRRSDPPSANS